MLNKRVKNLDAIDEKYQDLYVQDEQSGDFVLDFVDADAKAQVDEFRNNNRALNRQLEEMKSEIDKYSALGDVTPEDISGLLDARKMAERASQDELLKEIMLPDGSVDRERIRSYADKQFEGERKEMQRKYESLSSEKEELDTLLFEAKDAFQTQVRNSGIRDAIDGVARVREGAMDDILSRAERQVGFTEQGDMVVWDGNGEPRYGNKGGQYMTPQEWVGELVENAPHLFEGRVGGGAAGDGGRPKGPNSGPVVDGNNPEDLGRNFKAILEGKAAIRND
mgnify:CR=1 FL=1|tara:strand:- start:2078 stop:2917 length:840 start_codon:yes stop_codon:yes gene_type:complete